MILTNNSEKEDASNSAQTGGIVMSTAVLKTTASAPIAEESIRETVPEETRVPSSPTEEQPPAAKRKPKQVRKRFIIFCIVLFLVGAWLVTPIPNLPCMCADYNKEWRAPLYVVIQWRKFQLSGYNKTGIYFFPYTLRSAEEIWESCEAPAVGMTYQEAEAKESELRWRLIDQQSALYEAKLEQNKRDNREAFEKRQAELEAKKAAREASGQAAAEQTETSTK